MNLNLVKLSTTKDGTLKANRYLVLYVVKLGNSLLFLLIKETVQLLFQSLHQKCLKAQLLYQTAGSLTTA